MSALEPAQVLIERTLKKLGRPGVVIVTDVYDADQRFANNTTTTNGVRRSRQLSVIAIDEKAGGQSVGIASGSGSLAIDDLVDRALDKAVNAEVADDASALIDTGGIDSDFGADPVATDLDVFAPVLDDLGTAFARARQGDYRLFGFAQHNVETTYLGTSTGIRRRHVQPTGSFELVARADGARSTWRALASPDFSDVAFAELEANVLERLSWGKNRVELDAGRYQVLLPPDAVADLVIEFWAAMSGRDAEDGGNVFSGPNGATRVGEQLFSLPFDLTSDPRDELMPASPFLATSRSSSDVSVFDNGAELAAERYVSAGRLEHLRYHRAGAQRSKTEFCAPVDNLTLSLPGANTSLEEMIVSSERALLLTCLWYIREVDPSTLLLTGLTRDGVYLIEDGKVKGAVNNFRFNESPLDVLARSVEVGATKRALSREWGEWMNRTAMPALRVDGFNMSSVSPAN